MRIVEAEVVGDTTSAVVSLTDGTRVVPAAGTRLHGGEGKAMRLVLRFDGRAPGVHRIEAIRLRHGRWPRRRTTTVPYAATFSQSGDAAKGSGILFEL